MLQSSKYRRLNWVLCFMHSNISFPYLSTLHLRVRVCFTNIISIKSSQSHTYRDIIKYVGSWTHWIQYMKKSLKKVIFFSLIYFDLLTRQRLMFNKKQPTLSVQEKSQIARLVFIIRHFYFPGPNNTKYCSTPFQLTPLQ